MPKLANRIAALNFQDRRMRVWYDERDLKPGDFILLSIEQVIQEARFIVFVLTPEAVESDWVTFERIVFHTADPLGRSSRVIPLLLKDCQIPFSSG